MKTADNGVNVEALPGARAAPTETPPAARFTWRAQCDWVSGAQSRKTIDGFFGPGEEQTRTQAFPIEADHPTRFAATDKGATPTERAPAAAVAQHRGIQLKIDQGNSRRRHGSGRHSRHRSGCSQRLQRARFDQMKDSTTRAS
jgi:hypothetical protein